LSPLEVKEFFFKQIQPQLNTSNYGYDEQIIVNLKDLKKDTSLTEPEEQSEKIDEMMEQIHTSLREANDVFGESNDSLEISTQCFPRQQLNNTVDELHMPDQNVNEPQQSKSGNGRVRDEIGSSISVQPSSSHLDHRKAPLSYILSYPMYNFETGQVEARNMNLPKK
jgi:hypothetical protein